MERVLYRVSIKSIIVLICLLCVSQSALATTVVRPPDDDMLIGARAIVRGKVLSVGSAFDEHHNIYTYITIKVREVLKGQISERRIVIKEAGGQVGEQGSIVFGTPRFTRGEKVLLYLDTWKDGSLRVHQMFLGKFSIVQDERTGEEVAVRGEPDDRVDVLHTTSSGPITDRMELSAYLDMVHNGLAANSERSRQFEETYYGDAPLLAQPPEYRGLSDRGGIQPNFITINSQNPRWFEPDTGQPVMFKVNPDGGPGSNIVGDVTAAMNAWSSVPGCPLRVVIEETGGFCAPTFGLNTIIFNACDGRWAPAPGCAGILALGGLGWTGTTKVINGTTFHQATAGFVSVNPNALCNFGDPCNVREMLTHELGHAMGLGHSQDASATMFGIAHFDGRCASLRPDDVNGINFLYPTVGGGPGPLTVATTSLPNGTPSTPYNQPLIASGGTQPYSWSLVQGQGTLPPGLTLSAIGFITGTPTTNGSFSFTVRVTDNVGATAQKALGITVAAGVVPLNAQFVGQTVPTVVQPQQVINVNMKFLNTGSQTWSGGSFFFASQNPPLNANWGGNGVSLGAFVTAPGQTLDVNFTASAPAVPGTYNFQWQMYENGGIGFFGEMSANVSVQVGGSPITITTGSPLPGGMVGTSYSQSLAASGGTAPYTWSVVGGSLPAGVTLSSGGLLSGNPQTAGTFNFTVQASDSASGSAQKALAVTIAPAPIPVTITTGSPLPGAMVGTSYSQSLAASGGTAP
ncbi:MAG: putative Ig domain-containing protein, partial [Acidobacteriota bacterium]